MRYTPFLGLAGLLPAMLAAFPVQAAPASPPPGSKYVAMGSSFAAGAGITPVAPGTPTRCGRAVDNYPNQIARRRKLVLVDASCGGATTDNILRPWAELPPQIAAVDADTRLVTVTIGGNDIGYIGTLMGYSCARQTAASGASATRCPPVRLPQPSAFAELESRMGAIADEVKRRAPAARLVFVQYPLVLPRSGPVCAATPLSPAEVQRVRDMELRLARITAKVARRSGATLVPAATLSRGHDACSASPWMNGFSVRTQGDGSMYHPNRAGTAAVAQAVERAVWR